MEDPGKMPPSDPQRPEPPAGPSQAPQAQPQPPSAPTPGQMPPPVQGYQPAHMPPPGYGYYPPSAPAQPQHSSGAWKWFLGAFVVLTLAVIGCCGISFAMLAQTPDANMTFGDSVALIHLDGVIAGTGSYVNGYITPEEFLAQLDLAAADPNVKAIVIRADSPGGTVAASQEIATEVARFDKPIIVSVGDVCASGAYMISSQTDHIVASPTSAVGSIGVITQIPNWSELMDKVGIEFTTLTAGELKDTGSPYRSLTATETAMIQMEIDFAYDEFIRIVAEGRDMDEEDVRELATGWAWSASEAKEMGLVDELGTFNDALDTAADMGGIDGPYDIVSYDSYTYTDFLYSLIGIKDSLDRLGAVSPEPGVNGPAIPR